MMAFPLHVALPEQISSFARYLRQEGMITGVQEVLDAMQALVEIGMPDEHNLRILTRALFCNSKEDHQRFDKLFDNFWKGDSKRFKAKLSVSSRIKKQQKATSLIWLGGKSGSSKEGEKKQSKEISGANAEERLRLTDFSKLTEVESEELEKLARKLWQEMNKRMSRRYQHSHKMGRVNLRRTIRSSIGSGGNFYHLHFRRKKPRKPRLVVLLDVSGSMDKYSFFLLRFIYAIQGNFEQVESFLFSTRLEYISDLLKRNQLRQILHDLKQRAHGWSSGTTIGQCLYEFNKNYANYALSRQSIVLILSDGLDTGEDNLLRVELEKLTQRARRLIWLNPLKGTAGYQPTAKGMKAALPLVDQFSSAHNLDSLLQLEKHLANV